MIAIFIVVAFVVGALSGAFWPRYKTNEVESKPKKELDYEFIERVDQEIFGVGKDIVSLPGYKWRVEDKPLTYLMENNADATNIIGVRLIDPEGKRVSQRYVNKTTAGSHNRVSKTVARPRTAAELEDVIQHVMREEADKEFKRFSQQKLIADVISKYDGKAVNQDGIRNEVEA